MSTKCGSPDTCLKERMMMKKVGILGGTYDPIHIGHLLLGETALEAANLDEILYIPSAISYLKKDSVRADAKDRLEMTRLAVRDNPRFRISDIEIKRGGNSYTCETLEALQQVNPDWQLYYIVGADAFLGLVNWYEPARICATSTLLVANRDDAPEALLQERKQEYELLYQAKIKFLTLRRVEISSSWIREQLGEGKSVRYWMTDAVMEYIQKKALYLKHDI
jgi:nicotinate-nucleotide adenylyltransferase